MTYVKEYWENRQQRSEAAHKHTKEMKEKYNNRILDAIASTKIYGNDSFPKDFEEDVKGKNVNIIVEDMDSVSAVMKYGHPAAAVLNFSSYKNPGGLFLDGSKAQEECLCHESFLYNVLKTFQDSFYDWNNRHKNKALYLNRALFSRGIWFFRENRHVECSVITCAAPNKSTAQKYQNVSDEENTKVLKSRIEFILDVAKHNDADTLILGAYGCGVFGQDAEEVATIFKEFLTTTYKCFDTIVFAVPNGRDKNYEKFIKVFSRY